MTPVDPRITRSRLIDNENNRAMNEARWILTRGEAPDWPELRRLYNQGNAAEVRAFLNVFAILGDPRVIEARGLSNFMEKDVDAKSV